MSTSDGPIDAHKLNRQPPSAAELEAAFAFARPYFEHARRGNVDALRPALEAGLPANLTNDKGDTLLMLAAYHGRLEAVKLLLEHKADPNRLNDRGQSILAGAIFKNENEIVQALLENGANPHVGQPNAIDTARTFNKIDWVERFERVDQIELARSITSTSLDIKFGLKMS
ncbi:hypothetical protein OIV83_004054 [Microbotryomycetes sp. JL201]|nr:hypothetical protein OIV83_004054 [Microbotryomycetes sp. JL201]